MNISSGFFKYFIMLLTCIAFHEITRVKRLIFLYILPQALFRALLLYFSPVQIF